MEATLSNTTTAAETINKLKEITLGVTRLKVSPEEISDNANLFDDCGLDSTSVVELVIALEERFNITIYQDELVAALFQNLSTLAAFVEGKYESRD